MFSPVDVPQRGLFNRRFGVLACCLTVYGCNKPDQIRTYSVPKPHVVYEANHVARAGGAPPKRQAAAATPVPQTTLGLVAIHNEDAWFFKLMGPDAAVASVRDNVRQFMKSIGFDSKSGEPTWKLPENWSRKPGGQFRFATLELKTDSVPLELSVSRFPLRGDEETYMLSNVNRWRGQLGLRSLTPDQLSDSLELFELDGLAANFVEITGQAPLQNQTRPPFAGQGGGANADVAAATKTSLSYETPDGWRAGKLFSSRGGITMRYEAAFDIASGGLSAQVTVSRFPPKGLSLLNNINRWRQQVGLGTVTDAEVDESTMKVQMGDTLGHYIELMGESQATLALVSATSKATWYYKLSGDVDLVRQEREKFRDFIRSVKYND